MDRRPRPKILYQQCDRIVRQLSDPIPTLPNAPDPKYDSEEERLRTFEGKWSLPYIDYYLLARTGMYFIGTRDATRCQFCNLCLSSWEANDDPLAEHLKYSPNCPLLRRQPTKNIPMNTVTLDRSLPPNSPDECGGVCHTQPGAFQSTTCCSQQQATPAFPHYAQEPTRIESFKEWPKIMKHKVEALAQAGLFYVGRGDLVQCFSCGGLLKDWEEFDDPWSEHAIWHPECKFVKLVQGNEFIEECIAKSEERQKVAKEREETAVKNTAYDRQISVASSIGDLDENNVCKLCCLEERNTVFLPCGHVVACAKCALSVDKCPVCRLPYSDVNRLYFS